MHPLPNVDVTFNLPKMMSAFNLPKTLSAFSLPDKVSRSHITFITREYTHSPRGEGVRLICHFS
jgi:hypothetical protein